MDSRTLARICMFAALWLVAAGPVRAAYVDDLLKQAQSESAVDRAAAVRNLAAWTKPDDARPAQAILHALEDPDRYVRRAAVAAVQQALLFEAIPRLHALQQQDADSRVQSAAADALQDFRYRPGYDAYVVANSSDDKERLDSAIRLSYSARDSDVPGMIAALQRGGSPELQSRLIQGLGYSKSPVAVAPLVKALQDCSDDADPRKHPVIDALGAIGDTAAVPALLQAWTSDRYDESYVAAFKTIHDPRALPALAAHAHEQYNNAQYSWIQTFDTYGADGVTALVGVLTAKGGTDEQQAGALQILAGLHTPPPFGPLTASLTSPAQVVRFEAPAALANSRDPRAVPLLLGRLSGEQDRGVRGQIVSALGAAGDRRATAPLLAMLADPKEASFGTALVGALGRIGDPAAADALVAHYQLAARAGFVWDDVVALCGIGTAKAMAPVLADLHAGKTQVLQAGYACLVGYGEPGSEADLLAVLDKLTPQDGIRIADTFSRSGDSRLHDGAQAWAGRTGQRLYDGTDVVWGSRRKP